MQCRHCGKPLPEGACFCMYCGAEQTSAAAAAALEAQAAAGAPEDTAHGSRRLMPEEAAARAAMEARAQAARAAALLSHAQPRVAEQAAALTHQPHVAEQAAALTHQPRVAEQAAAPVSTARASAPEGAAPNTDTSLAAAEATQTFVPQGPKSANPAATPAALLRVPHGTTDAAARAMLRTGAAEQAAERAARAAEIFSAAHCVANEEFTREFSSPGTRVHAEGGSLVYEPAQASGAQANAHAEPTDAPESAALPPLEESEQEASAEADASQQAAPKRHWFASQPDDPENAPTQYFDPAEEKQNLLVRTARRLWRGLCGWAVPLWGRLLGAVRRFFSDPRRTVASLLAALVVCAVVIPCAILAGNTTKRLESFVNDGNWQAAQQLYEEKIALNAERKESADAMLREKLQSAYDDYNAGTLEYLKAQTCLVTIDKMGVFPDTQSAVDALTELHTSKAAFAAGETHLAASEWLKALEEYARVIEADTLYPTAKSQTEKARQMYRSGVITQAEELLASGSYEDALSLLDEALTVMPNDAELLAEKQRCADAEVEDALKQASKVFGAVHDWKAAVAVLDEALLRYPDNARLQEARAQYAAYQPVWLNTLTASAQQGDLTLDSVLRDNYGNTYTHSLAVTSDAVTALINGLTGRGDKGSDKRDDDDETSAAPSVLYVEYALSGQYLRFTGVCGVPENASLFDFFGRDSYFVVSGDGKTLFTSDTMKNQSTPQSFSLDVSGVQTLRIEWPQASSARSFLFDGQLSK